MSRPDTVCPLCDRGFDARTDLRIHLMTVHDKSAVVDELLTARADADRKVRPAP